MEVVDWAKMRVTNMKGNRRLYMPGPITRNDYEIRWRNAEVMCMKVAREVREELMKDFGRQKFLNIDRSKQKGLKSLVEKRRGAGLVYYETDKSGKMTVDEVENFTKKMEPHLTGMREVDAILVEEIEKEMNSRSKCWARILNIGSAWGHEKRVKEALTSASGVPPVLCCMGYPRTINRYKRIKNIL